MSENQNWRSSRDWKRPSFPPRLTPEITNIIEFPFVQSHRSESFLRQKYEVEELSPLEIGQLCFSSKRTILAWLEEFKIPIRSDDVPVRRGLRFGEKRVRGRVVEHEGQAKTIRLMNDLRAKGYSYPQIVDVLNSMGVRSKLGGRWHLQTVFSALNKKTKPPSR